MIVVALFLTTGCRHGHELSEREGRGLMPIQETAIAPISGELFAGIGPGVSFSVRPWRVAIDGEGRLSVTHGNDTGETTMSPKRWRMLEGSFVYVENDENLWVGNADGRLVLFIRLPSSFGFHGGDHSPRPIPEIVTEHQEQALAANGS